MMEILFDFKTKYFIESLIEISMRPGVYLFLCWSVSSNKDQGRGRLGATPLASGTLSESNRTISSSINSCRTLRSHPVLETP